MKLHEIITLGSQIKLHETPVMADGPVVGHGLHTRADFEYEQCRGTERELSPTWKFKETKDTLVYAHFNGRVRCNIQLFIKSPLLGVQCTAVSKMSNLGGTLDMIMANYDDALRNRSINKVLSSDSILSIGGWRIWDKLMDKYGHNNCYVAIFTDDSHTKLVELIKMLDVKSQDQYTGKHKVFQIRLP